VADARRNPRPPDEWDNVHDLIAQVRLRPGMWVHQGSVQEPSTMLFGYSLALEVHRVPEPFDFHPSRGAFARWLRQTQGRPMNQGWASAIEENTQDHDALGLFFSLYDQYLATASAVPSRDGNHVRRAAPARRAIRR
jgi:hypothetical protein